MPTTLGFPTPADSTVLAQVYAQIRALATAVDAYFRGSNGVPTLAANVISAGDGIEVRKRGNTVTLTAELGISGANKPAGGSLFTIPTGYRPVGKRAPSICYTSAGTSLCLITTAGDVNFPFLALNNGSGAYILATWEI